MAEYQIKRPLFLNGRLLPAGTKLAFEEGAAPKGAKLLSAPEDAEPEPKKQVDKQTTLKELAPKTPDADADTFSGMNKGK